MQNKFSVVLSLAVVLTVGAIGMGCGGNRRGPKLSELPLLPNLPPGTGGPGGPTTTAQVTLGAVSAQRLSSTNGLSAPAVSLSDQMTHPYTVYAKSGNAITFTLTGTPVGAQLEISTALVTSDSTIATMASTTVTLPHTFTLTPTRDGVVNLRIFDPFRQAALSSLVANAASKPFSSNSFQVVFHFAGDRYTGFTPNNSLATNADKVAFAQDLVARANAIYASTGVNMTFNAATGITNIGSPALAAVSSDMVLGVGGESVLTTGNFRTYGTLGAPSGDANNGKALDVFILNRTNSALDGTLGICSCFYSVSPDLGGIFVGNGLNHHVNIVLMNSSGVAAGTLDELGETFAHEVGHFLSLRHPTESALTYDDFSDTPEIPKSADTNNNGKLDSSEVTTSSPGATNNMFFLSLSGIQQRTLTSEQSQAMQTYLTLTDH